MEATALTLLVLFYFLGFLAIFFTSIGTLIIFAGCLLFGWMTQFEVLTIYALLMIGGLYLIGEIIEYVCVVWGAKTFGASTQAAWGGVVGGLLGAFVGLFGLFFGVFMGALIGIFCGAFVVELLMYNDVKRSLKAGVGGVVGRVGSIFVKVFIALLMLGVIVTHLMVL